MEDAAANRGSPACVVAANTNNIDGGAVQGNQGVIGLEVGQVFLEASAVMSCTEFFRDENSGRVLVENVLNLATM